MASSTLFLAACAATTALVHGLDFESLNSRLVNAEYAVRGPVLDLAKELQVELRNPTNDLPFDELYFCNIGNPQALGQKPLSFNREVLSLVQMPSLLDSPAATDLFSQPAQQRARQYLDAIRGGIGAYSDSQGYSIVRDEVADFITARDGPELGKASAGDIFLTDGASAGVKMMFVVFDCDVLEGITVGANISNLTRVTRFSVVSTYLRMF